MASGHFEDVPDPTDWLPTPLAGLAAVETALQCKVCKEPYKTPMLTSCSHTFCSECIRRALGNDGKCPLCRASDQESKLRNNWSMEEAVEAFAKARTSTLTFARVGPRENSRRSSPKRKRHESESLQAEAVPQVKRLRSSARLSQARADEPAPTVPRDEVEVIDDTDDEDYEDPEIGKCACP